MLLDFEVQRSTRRCAATDRALEPGETCYSVLEVQGADVVRKDYCKEAWTAPPESAFGWWRTRIPEPTAKKVKLAPNEVLLELFDQMADRPDQEDLRYVLTLLLIRRRVLRLDLPGDGLVAHPSRREVMSAVETMRVYCPKRDATYEVPVAMPDAARIDEIQQQLSELLAAGAE
ncbi:MAG TPA: hypothetical protein VJ828_14800 [Lacipirellulaceae bacterium]|jgi:hypothetical protein|nr:hypothetical protein [Lacipirellulaceae bacterium]